MRQWRILHKYYFVWIVQNLTLGAYNVLSYDIIFLLSRWEGLQTNIPYLQNALIQTNYRGEQISRESWKSVMSAFARNLNWRHIQDDIRSIVISDADSDILDLNILLDLLS